MGLVMIRDNMFQLSSDVYGMSDTLGTSFHFIYRLAWFWLTWCFVYFYWNM